LARSRAGIFFVRAANNRELVMMQDLYDNLPGRPEAANDGADGRHEKPDGMPRPAVWDEADGEGPDRLFNRYRRLRLQALAGNAA
jgi:hypothetical protein